MLIRLCECSVALHSSVENHFSSPGFNGATVCLTFHLVTDRSERVIVYPSNSSHQGCMLSPISLHRNPIEVISKIATEDLNTRVNCRGENIISNLKFADDASLLADSSRGLERLTVSYRPSKSNKQKIWTQN